jgi:phage FluMu gp28-like protein
VTSQLRSLRAQFLVEHLDLEAATQVEGAKWEHFQLAHLNDERTFRIEVKSRQIAWSWLSAIEGLADAILAGRSSIYVSINLEEAKEKIRYARLGAEALPSWVRPTFTRDNELMVELANGARLISLPARPPRGKARMNVYLDEFAHVRDDRKIYTGALPVISKGGGRLRVASSPLGASGVFWEVYAEQLRAYPGYGRKATPWWLVQAFCVNAGQAKLLAPTLPTAERVELFGNERIKAIFANLPEEDFQQEYECAFVDEATAWISWEEIRGVQDKDLRWVSAQCTAEIDGVDAAIAELRRLLDAGLVEPTFAGGMDIGRTRNATELFLVGLSTVGSYPLRLALTLQNCDFDAQLAAATAVLKQLPVSALLIDHNGMGRNLAESLGKAFPTKAQGVDFTNASKTLWATDAKMLVQQRKTPIPVDRDIAYQIHSIKKTITAAKNLVFDTDRNEKHHADKFWAWALALAAARSAVPTPAVAPLSLPGLSRWT